MDLNRNWQGWALHGVPLVLAFVAMGRARAVEGKETKLEVVREVIQEAIRYGEAKWAADYKVEVLPVQGTVFLDRNGNGTREAGEPPVANVRVSDGYTVVRTDKDGRYSLWAPREYVNVAVTVPSRFWPTEAMRGWFKGLDLSQVEKAEVNFALQRKEWPEKIRFFHCSDLDGGARSIRNVPKAAAEDPLFVEINDDLPGLYARGRDEWDAYVKPFVDRKIPIFATTSNHDSEYGSHEIKDGVPPKDSDNYRWPHRLGRWFFLRNIGPLHYSVDIAGYHLIHVDKYASRIRDGSSIWPGSGGWKGSSLPAELVLWLKEDLKHVPKTQPILFFGGDLADPGKLSGGTQYIQDKLLAGYTVQAAFSGEVNCMYGSRGSKFGERDDPKATGTQATLCGAPIFNFGDHGKFFTVNSRVKDFPGEEAVSE